MNPGGYNIKTILQVLYAAVKDVAEARYVTERPNATSQPTDTFVVVAAPVRIYNHLAYGDTTCRISLYARDIVSTNRGSQENGNALGKTYICFTGIVVVSNYAVAICFTRKSLLKVGVDVKKSSNSRFRQIGTVERECAGGIFRNHF